MGKDLDNLSILDLMQLISGQPLLLTNCLADNQSKRKGCQIRPERCNIVNSMKRVQMKVDNLIKNITLKEIMEI